MNKRYENISKMNDILLRLEAILTNAETLLEELNKDYEEAGRKNDVGKLMEIQEEFDRLDSDEMEAMEEWDSKSEELKGFEE